MNEPAFPLAAPPFDGRSRVVAPESGLEWLKQGWGFFLIAPAQWVGITLLFLLIMVALFKVPIVGRFVLAHLATPILVAGTLLACQKAAHGQKPELRDLFAGCRRNARGLMLLGVLYLAGIVVIAGLVLAVGGGTVAGGLALGDSTGIGLALGGFVLAVLLACALAAPLFMAIWFAPALVFFNNMAPVAALKASLDACLKNGLPFVVYALFAAVLLIFAALPVGLGLLVLIPVICGSLYASYRDLFLAD